MIQEKIGSEIKTRRQAMGISQEKFSLMIEMDRTYLASVEAGKRNISIKNLEKIIPGLNSNFSDFFKNFKEDL